MGIAWFDDVAPPAEDRALRVGGLPMLPQDQPWPVCPRCDLPLLFRAQVPLALTSLVAFDDDRLLLLFECHAFRQDGPCDGSAVIISSGPTVPRPPPRDELFDVWLGVPRSTAVRALVCRLRACDSDCQCAQDAGAPVLAAVPASIAGGASAVLNQVGGRTLLRPSAPTILTESHGGRLVPYDDCLPGFHRTTLPPLEHLDALADGAIMRGLLGGPRAVPGGHHSNCRCGRPPRTAVRLLRHRQADPCGAHPGPAWAEVCLRCGEGELRRS